MDKLFELYTCLLIIKKFWHQRRFSTDYMSQLGNPFDANMNAPEAVALIKQSAAALQLEYIGNQEPFRWGEDFGLFTNLYPGAMFGIGAGENCMPLHHPAYDYPDSITQTGLDMFITLQQKAQQL